jgi:polysaccharide deacetylase 2 family uncharacterized protein YibQ
MDRKETIRRRGVDLACLLLSLAALALGGSAALSGAGVFAAALMPQMSAEATAPAHDAARLTIAEPFAASRYSPQVLFPVSATPFPDWLRKLPQPLLPRFVPPPVGAPKPDRPVIAICIDDLGEDLAGTDRAIALPKAVALSFLPYAEATPFLATEAERKGHSVLAHVPMQAMGSIDPGPMALKVGMKAAEIARRMHYALARVPGLSGINNHEGSRFTADAKGLVPVVQALKARHLFFLDSRTGPDSKVTAVAAAAGVQTAARDVFLDDDRSPAAIDAQLALLARRAKRNGAAIAIGHPHDTTLTTLAAWLKQDHGVTLVPLEEAMRHKQTRQTAYANR